VAATQDQPKGADAEFDAAMRDELDRRIAALAEAGEASFGSIGRGEWALTVLVTLVIPLLLVWAFA
jgi:hypothetical protein